MYWIAGIIVWFFLVVTIVMFCHGAAQADLKFDKIIREKYNEFSHKEAVR